MILYVLLSPPFNRRLKVGCFLKQSGPLSELASLLILSFLKILHLSVLSKNRLTSINTP